MGLNPFPATQTTWIPAVRREGCALEKAMALGNSNRLVFFFGEPLDHGGRNGPARHPPLSSAAGSVRLAAGRCQSQ